MLKSVLEIEIYLGGEPSILVAGNAMLAYEQFDELKKK